jgi:hypothetical protein
MGGKEAARTGGGEAEEGSASQKEVKSAPHREKSAAALNSASSKFPPKLIPFLIEP